MLELKYTPGSVLCKGESDKQYLAQKENKENRSMEEKKKKKKKQDETGHFSDGLQCAAMVRDLNTRVSFCLCSVFPTLHYQTVF